MLAAAVIGVASAITGLYLSFWLDVASGATIVLVETFVFALALAYRRVSSLVHPNALAAGDVA
jgi:manganese/iron transport system permease protein